MTITMAPPRRARTTVDGLENGNSLTQSEFHQLYRTAPPGFRAELIGGIVHVPSPVSIAHGEYHSLIIGLLFPYQFATKGIQVVDNTSLILGVNDEPQPDVSVRILPEYGGQSGTTDEDYIDGAPELIIEVATSSRSIDMYSKRSRYEATGVLEYLIVNTREGRLHWFDLQSGSTRSIDSDGIVRTQVMPGLWIDSKAVIEKNGARMMAILNQGLATPEHVAFVQKLAGARKS